MSIKKIVGIMSCKGGVGKSTLAVNLAVTLAFFYGKKVGLLDADIHGPNHPKMLGFLQDSKDEMKFGEEKLVPKKCHGILSMSMGYFLNSNSSVLLRGPMASNTVNYFLKKTDWGCLDILIVDFPPGTGDIYLSMLRDITFDCVYLITTPQLVSIEDLRRSISMLKKFDVYILGILENMKYYKCNNCKVINHIYGKNNEVKMLADSFNIPFIHELPLDVVISNSSNSGTPFVLSSSSENLSSVLKSIAKNLL